MTALRIFHTARPSLIGARVLPMNSEDRRFWTLFAERASQKERKDMVTGEIER